MAHFFALVKHGSTLIAQIPVGVNLHLQAAIAEDAFGDHRDHVHALGFGRDDKRCRFVIGVGGGGTNAGDKYTALGAVDGGQGLGGSLCIQPRMQSLCFCALRLLAQEHHGVESHQHAAMVSVAVAGAYTPF